jgi:hypothetical protein
MLPRDLMPARLPGPLVPSRRIEDAASGDHAVDRMLISTRLAVVIAIAPPDIPAGDDRDFVRPSDRQASVGGRSLRPGRAPRRRCRDRRPPNLPSTAGRQRSAIHSWTALR